ncbi:hypothetical protein AURANDRAFT_20283 [Aureococcus anophagefferens]|uniref:Uncharacterized protein n=1 Tax=Aureococcus anophagefferens TaxID=44056 RepID=F0XYS1_AURAN|nr:hypothetical protein AURANDRAFT_20283 [Aureococcus anophagefferens]EGB11812.1 hypothetical protein AURANDRAFT_20283 [Aureococcus anophagefferens]|eukprot:XP_009032936.1 hypothetical protein AURANDRAFT_20283 [Aureococcus anophagefferens]
MVEFAFDGELDEVRALIDKGYYVDSVDGRKHTPLSDACAQGHVATVEYLLELGADPNSKSDLSRTPMWRAAYNGEAAMVKLLLEAGGDPTIPTTDFERPFDVAKDDATRDVLSARRPRATANTARDDRGATLLHLAAQHGHLELAELLLTHAATLDPPHGWTPLSVAVFHDRKRLAKLLLDHGGDPNLANQFGHTAFDVAKDQVASDERTVLKDKSEVRAVLEEWDRDARSKLFGTSGDVKVADGAAAEELPAEGTGVALQVEMAADDAARDAAPPKKKKGAGAKKAAAAVGRMSAKKGGKKKK